MKHRFSYGKVLAIGSGFFAISVVWMVYNTFMPLILGEFIESKTIRGGIMGLDNLLAVFLIPMIGSWSDRLRSRLGQRLPFIAVGMPLAALLFFLLPLAKVSVWTLLALDIVFLIAMTIYRAPVISLMPDHTPPEKRSTANGLINLMGGVGSLLALFVLAPLYDKQQAVPFWIAGLVLLAAFFFLLRVVDRNPPYAGGTAEEQEEVLVQRTFRAGLRELFQKRYRAQLYVLVAIFFYFIGYAGVEAQFSTYATGYLGMTGGAAGTTLGFFSVSFMLFAFPAGMIGSKIGKTRAMMIGLVLLPVVFLLVPFFKSVAILRVLMFCGGIGWALINVQAYPLIADLGGKTQIGFFTGLYYFFSMLSQIVAPAFLGAVMDFVGYQALYVAAAASVLVALFFLRKGSKGLAAAPVSKSESM